MPVLTTSPQFLALEQAVIRLGEATGREMVRQRAEDDERFAWAWAADEQQGRRTIASRCGWPYCPRNARIAARARDILAASRKHRTVEA